MIADFCSVPSHLKCIQKIIKEIYIGNKLNNLNMFEHFHFG